MTRRQASGVHHAALAALAREIAADLMTDGFGHEVDRLALMESETEIGCWRIEKLERRILRHLRGEMR